jgi:hypothetical protein
MCLGIEAQMPATIAAECFATKLLDLSALWIDGKVNRVERTACKNGGDQTIKILLYASAAVKLHLDSETT